MSSLFDPLDNPLGHSGIGPQKKSFRLDFGFGPRPRRSDARFPPMQPEEAEGFGKGLLHRTLSGLHYVGSTLDKTLGGRAIRGVLAGKPREALSILPGSDTLGITDYEKDNTTGDELLKNAGFDTTGGNWLTRNLAGPAVEIALDPATWLSFGGKHALSEAGRLARGMNETKGWGHRALIEGFHDTEPALMDRLMASGRTAVDATGDIAHMRASGSRIASRDLVDAARAKGLDIVPNEALSGIAGVGLPFGKSRAIFGTGAKSQAVAGAFDKAHDFLGHMPGVRQARALFDGKVGRADDPAIMRSAESIGAPSREAVESQVRAGEYGLRKQFDEIMDASGHLPGAEMEAARVIRGAGEGAPMFRDFPTWHADFTRRQAAGLARHVADPAATAAHIQSHFDHLAGMGTQIRDFGDLVAKQSEAHGIPLRDLNDPYVEYLARRHISAAPGFQGTQQAKLLPLQHGSNIGRERIFRGVAGGTEQINDWAIDPRLVGPSKLDDAQRMAIVMGDEMRNRTLAHGSADPKSVAAKARHLLTWLDEVNPAHSQHAIPYFNPDIIGDMTMRGQRHAQVYGAANAMIDAATKMARPIDQFTTGDRMTHLGDFLNKNGDAGLHSDVGWKQLTPAEEAAVTAAGFGSLQHARDVASDPAIASAIEQAYLARLPPGLDRTLLENDWKGAVVQAYRGMAPRGFGDVREAIAGRVNPLAELNKFALSHDDAGKLTRYMVGWRAPTEVHPFLESMKKAQILFKNAVYPLWPASHVRNFTSALYNNWIHGTPWKAYEDAHALLSGKGIEHAEYALAGAAMNPMQRAEALKQAAYAHAKVGAAVNSFRETVGSRGLEDAGLHGALKGQHRLIPRAPMNSTEKTFGEAFSAPGAFNPLGMEGLGGGWFDRMIRGDKAAVRHEDTFAPLVLGRKYGSQIEDSVRMANFLGNLRQGMNPDAAGSLTRAIHFDYSDLSNAERAVMKNVVPFYTYMRKNMPYQIDMLMHRPSAIAPMLHAIGGASGSDWTPDYLASGPAIPLSEESPTGNRQFISKFGLPFEEAMERFKFRNYQVPGLGTNVALPAVGDTAMAFMGAMTPYLKAPLEFLTNRQFHTGRELSDLHSKGIAGGYGYLPEEVAQPLTELVANSPLARVASSLDRAFDPRKTLGVKALNLLTGVKITDLDMNKQRAIAQRKAIEEGYLAHDPRVKGFTNYYLSPDFQGPPPPELENALRFYSGLKQGAKGYSQDKTRQRLGADLDRRNALRGSGF